MRTLMMVAVVLLLVAAASERCVPVCCNLACTQLCQSCGS